MRRFYWLIPPAVVGFMLGTLYPLVAGLCR